jgi:hypothetical protein
MWFGFALSACGLLFGTPMARGGTIIATVDNGLRTGTLGGPNGDYAVWAFSNQNQINNNTVSANVVLNGTTVMNPGTAVPQGGQFAILTGGTNGYFPKAQLTKLNDLTNITSNTLQYTGSASAFVDNAGKKITKALATNKKPAQNPQMGKAIGEVIDPYMISSGSNAYLPTVSASIQLDGVGDSGSATYSAVDSYVFTSDTVENFYSSNAPLSNALWSLTLSGSGPTLSTAAVSVDFEFNPKALNEITFPPSYLATLGSYSDPTTEAALINLSMDASIRGALTYNSAGEVDLPAGYSPFPVGTTFTPAGAGVQYGDAAEAEIVGVPEPAPGALLMAAVGAGVMLQRVRRALRRQAD